MSCCFSAIVISNRLSSKNWTACPFSQNKPRPAQYACVGTAHPNRHGVPDSMAIAARQLGAWAEFLRVRNLPAHWLVHAADDVGSVGFVGF
jgi:hypothetical protein